MKKIYFIILMMFVGALQSQIITFPDSNLKTKLLSASTANNIAQDINNNNIKIDTNSNNEIEVSEALSVYNLNLGNSPNQLTNLITNLSGIETFTHLKYLNIDYNNVTIVDATPFSNLEILHVSFNPITSLSANNLLQLKWLWCRSNQLTSLDISNLPNLEDFRCSGNQLTSLNLSNKPNLKLLYCAQNNLGSLNVTGLVNLEHLDFSQNPISSINLSGITKLKAFNSMYTNIQIVDLNAQHNLKTIMVGNNPSLKYVFMKNGSYEDARNFQSVPNLKYVCIDTNNYLEPHYMQLHAVEGGNNFTVNSYCNFTPGGTVYTIQGNTKYDFNGNGCDSNDLNKSFQKFNIVGSGGIGSLTADNSGNYQLPVQNGSHTITPVIENPAYFNISPQSMSVNFPSQATPFTQNFCLAANGTHHDLETVILPVTIARPGFDAQYKIIYKNKGTSVQSGSLSFSYNHNVMNYLSSSLTPNSQSPGILTWNFTNLLPFETREITVTVHLNTPTQTPPLTSGAILQYNSQINGDSDDTPADNTFALNQTVVNSFDPNDKTCLEGNLISQAKVGDYVHYLIRFENTGTANAQNIVVKDEIDTSKYDVSTLVALNGSHSFVTRTTGNNVEFIFENIQLPFDDANNDGYVSFKIKTKSTLAAGDSFSNKANIYFDYNAPIITNTYTTTVQNILAASEINNTKKDFSIYPNPVQDILYIRSNNEVIKAEIYDATGRILRTTGVKNNSVSVSGFNKGNYIIKIFTKSKTITYNFIKA